MPPVRCKLAQAASYRWRVSQSVAGHCHCYHTAALPSVPRCGVHAARGLAGIRGCRAQRHTTVSQCIVCPAFTRPHTLSTALSGAPRLATFAELQSRSAVAWEDVSPGMKAALADGSILQPEDRWEPRAVAACVLCARRFWKEELPLVRLAGEACFMAAPS